MVSSSAVYPEYGTQPFAEESLKAENKFWGKYGTDKIAAENMLLEKVSDAYILRPPYLYGPMNNVYREAFVLDCALADRKFYLPKDGSMKLQFFHVKDLCRLMELIIESTPQDHILNVGNKETVSIKEWVEYCLDVSRINAIYTQTIPLEEGIKEAALWYLKNASEVNKKPLLEYIDNNLLSDESDNA